jgi:exopolysaccharide biosynthesis polyprenyl glycosylphosphotransferase
VSADPLSPQRTANGAPASTDEGAEAPAPVVGLHDGVPGPPASVEYRWLYGAMAVTDAIAVAIGLFLAYDLRAGDLLRPREVLLLLAATPVAVVSVFAAFRLYQAHHFAPAEEFRRIILAVSVSVGALVVASSWVNPAILRGWVLMALTLGIAAAVLERRIWHWWVARMQGKDHLRFTTLVVGTNAEALHLARTMERPTLGFRVVGLVGTDGTSDPASDHGVPVLGSVRALRDLIRRTEAECVFVAASAVDAEQMQHVARAVRLEGIEVRVTATLPEVLTSRLAVRPMGGTMALSLAPVRLTGAQTVAKRIFDLVLAGAALALTSPLWLVIAAAIKSTSRGPVLYRQRRVGRRGDPFTILKFRTMVDGADRMLESLKGRNEASGPLFKLRDDPRVSRVGRWLRRWSLDELPQLVNVLRGEMSLVGPRPPLPEEVSSYEDWQFDRLEVKPGITGLWQISGRSELSFDEYVRLDLFYIENWSLAYDLYILVKTLPVLVSRRGAY